MRKILHHYILTEEEMDEILYDLDKYRKYKIMAELEWEPDEEDPRDNQ